MINALVRHQVRVSRYAGDNARAVGEILAQALARVRDKLGASVVEGMSWRQLRNVEGSIQAALIQFGADAADVLTKRLAAFAAYESSFIVATLGKFVSVEVSTPAPDLIRAAASNAKFELAETGQTLSIRSATRDFARSTADDMAARLRSGVVAGDTQQQIIKDVMGMAETRTPAQAEALVRTLTHHVAAEASAGVYQANARLLAGEQWISTLDGRTTQGCAALHLHIYPVGKGPTTPRHWRCRSIRAPYIDPKYKLGGVGRIATSGGPIDADTTFDDWLRAQPDEFQSEFFGKFPQGGAKLKLWKAGLKLDRFADSAGAAYTLDELIELDKSIN